MTNHPEIFTTIDLELTQPSRKIIQLGAVVGNITTGKVIDRLNIFVNPEEKLTNYIINLTGITQNQVDAGTTLQDMYNQLKVFHNKSFINFVQWGQGDAECISQAVNAGDDFIGGRRIIDVKTLYVAWRLARGESAQGGLAKSMTKLGLKFQGRKHNALSDAENTFYMFCALLKKMRA